MARRRRLPRGLYKRGRSFVFRDQRDGKHRRITLGTDYAAAMRRYPELVSGKVTPRMTVVAAAQRWLETYIATRRTARDEQLARTRVQRYLVPFLGHTLLSKVTGEDLREYRLWLERQQDGSGKTISAQTVKHILSDARCFLRWAEDAGYMERSPFPRGVMPRIQETPPKRLTDEDVVKLLALPEPWAFVIRLGLGTGLRWFEMVRARVDHVERRGDHTVLTVSHTKSGKIRRIRLSQELAAEIRGRVGLLVPQANYWHSVLRIRRLSGVTGFHPHQLRHTFSCRWSEQGGSLASLGDPGPRQHHDDAAIRSLAGRLRLGRGAALG